MPESYSVRGRPLVAGLVVAVLLLLGVACGPSAPAQSTAAPAQPAPTTAPQRPAATAAPQAQPAATATGEPSAGPIASPAASPVARAAASPAAAAAQIGRPMEQMAAPSVPVKDTIVASMGQNPDSLHPFLTAMTASSEVLAAVFTFPIVYDDRGEWVAVGLEQVPTLENGGARFVGEGDDRHLEVTFKLKPGIRWHDGQPTTARDMVYAWELAMTPDFPVTTRSGVIKYSTVEAVDERTVVARFMSARQARDAAANGYMGLPAEGWAGYAEQREPVIDPLYFLPPTHSIDQVGWLPEHILADIPPDQQASSDYARQPVGNGPFRLIEWQADEQLRLEAVGDYFLGAPHTPNLVIRIIPDVSGILAALHAGELDVVLQAGGPDVDRAQELDSLQGYTPHYIAGTAWEHLDLNMQDPVLSDRNVRKALMMSVNRQQIVERLLFGKARVASSWIQPGLPAWAYDPDCLTPYRYDPAAAGRLLEQAGYTRGGDGIYQKDGQPLRLRLSTSDVALRRNVSQVIQADLRQAGIDLELDLIPGRGLFAQDGPLLRGTFQLGLFTWTSDPDPGAVNLYHSKSIPTEENNWVGQNIPRIANPRLDELLIQGAQELAVQQRKQAYCEAVRVWTDEVPVIPLFQRPITTVARAEMGNFRPTAAVTPETWNAWAWFVPR